MKQTTGKQSLQIKQLPRVYAHRQGVPSARPAAPVSVGHWGLKQGETAGCNLCSWGLCGTWADYSEVLLHAQMCSNETI